MNFRGVLLSSVKGLYALSGNRWGTFYRQGKNDVKWNMKQRYFSLNQIARLEHKNNNEAVRHSVTFIDKQGIPHEFRVEEGKNLLDIAQDNDLEVEGACGGACACSTCHVIIDSPTVYEKLPVAEDEENDMLDLAFGLTEYSRLGCQVRVTKDVDGMVVRLPSMTRNMQKSDFT